MENQKIEIVSKQIEELIRLYSKVPTGLTTAEVALIASLIGAFTAIFAQTLIFILTKCKEKKNLKKELIAEERRISYLLTEYYKELVMHKVHKMYWYRTSEILNVENADSKDSHNRHFESNQKSFETLTTIRITTSDYFKKVTHFINITKKNKIITKALNEIKAFEPRKANNFSDMLNYDNLLEAQAIEETKLNEVYRFYSNCFDKIYNEMTKIK